MSYCIYLRKSRADKELEIKEDVLLRHERALLDLAESKNYNITKIFREVVSGETLAARPQMQELLSEVENGLWDGVLVMEVERLARGNTIDQGIVSQAFKLSDTLIITPAKIYNPKNEFDEEYFEFGLFMSRREWKTINRRLSAGRLASCKEGKFAGGTTPYGYDKVKLEGEKGYKLVTIESEAEIVKLVYNLYLSNEVNTGFQGIANKLSAGGVPTRTGKAWSAAQIKNILTNDVYIGKIHWQKTPEIKKSKNGTVVKTRTVNPNCPVFDGLHDPIIDPDTYNKVQNIINSRKAPITIQRPMQNPFAGILVCDICGKPLKRRPVDSRRPGHSASYDCITGGCPTVGCPVNIVENKILAGIKLWLDKYKIELKNTPSSDAVYNDVQIQICNKKLNELQNQLERTFTLLEQGIYDKDTFFSRQNFLKKEIESVINIIENLENEDKITKARTEYSSRLIPQIENLLEIYTALPDAKSKNDLIKKVFYQIRYTKTTKGNRWNPDDVDNFKLKFVSKLPSIE
ncbi:MAG: recombinase family protein [Clostridia bacterium]|nr:recombinase family protein [Clostridia bacterium]